MTRPQKTQLDFSKYRTSDVIETISDIISLPGAIKSIIKWAMLGVAILVFLVALVLKLTGDLSLFWWSIFEVYAAPAGSIVGLTLGLAEFIRRSLSNMTKLVDLLLATTMQVAVDAKELSAGDAQMPPTRDLVEDVYEQVILVVTKEVLESMFGLFGRPVYWLYHVTLNQMVRIAIKFIPSATEMPPEMPSKLPPTLDAISEATDEQGRVVASLLWTQRKFANLGGWLKLLVMIPCYAIVTLVIGLIMLPPVLAWWLFL